MRANEESLMSGAVYSKLSSISRKKLDQLHKTHMVHHQTFSGAMERKMDEITLLQDDRKRMLESARREMEEESVLSALATTVDLRFIKAEIVVAKSIAVVIRSNMFFHRMMETLIMDVKMGVEYDRRKLEDLIPLEFSDMVSTSILSTNMSEMVTELTRELEEQLGEGEGR